MPFPKYAHHSVHIWQGIWIIAHSHYVTRCKLVGYLSATDVEQFEQEGLPLLEGLPVIFVAGLPAVFLVRRSCGGLAGLTLYFLTKHPGLIFVKPH